MLMGLVFCVCGGASGKLCLSAPGGVREVVGLSEGGSRPRVVEGSARAAFKRKARRFIVTLDLQHKP